MFLILASLSDQLINNPIYTIVEFLEKEVEIEF